MRQVNPKGAGMQTALPLPALPFPPVTAENPLHTLKMLLQRDLQPVVSTETAALQSTAARDFSCGVDPVLPVWGSFPISYNSFCLPVSEGAACGQSLEDRAKTLVEVKLILQTVGFPWHIVALEEVGGTVP